MSCVFPHTHLQLNPTALHQPPGAKTQLAGFVTSIVVMLVLLFMTPGAGRWRLFWLDPVGCILVQLFPCFATHPTQPTPPPPPPPPTVFEKLPYNTIAAIIIVGVSQLVELDMAVYLFKVGALGGFGGGGGVRLVVYVIRPSHSHTLPPTEPTSCSHIVTWSSRPPIKPSNPQPPPPQTHLRDFVVWLAAFVCTLFLGAELGLAISIGLALLIVILETAFPHTAVLGQIERTTVYRWGGGWSGLVWWGMGWLVGWLVGDGRIEDQLVWVGKG
jgi:hypothetical protein